MGQTQTLVSRVSQQLNQAGSVVADASGNAKFTFPNPPTGLVWTGTLCVAGAPSGALFSAAIGAKTWGTWAGNSVAGPVQCLDNQQLVVTASGLTPGSSYELDWTGSSDERESVQYIFPEANTSALFAQTSGTVDTLANGSAPGLSAGTQNLLPSSLGVRAQGSYACLILELVFSGAPPITFMAWAFRVDAQGVVTNFPPVSTVNGNPSLFLPVACKPGDTVGVTFVSSVGGNLSWKLYGSTVAIANPFPTRSDGRPYPLGLKSASANPGAVGTYTVIAAPGNGLRILIKNLIIVGGARTTGSSFGYFWGTIGGTTVPLLGSSGSTTIGGPNQSTDDAGIALDVAAPLQFVVSSPSEQSWLVSALYDLCI